MTSCKIDTRYDYLKNKTERYFALHLDHNKLKYEYEPYKGVKGSTNPDFLVFGRDGKKTLVECKELDFSSIDKGLSYNKEALVIALDNKNFIKKLRKIIHHAASQLKPYKDVDYKAIVLGKFNGFSLGYYDIVSAIKGDLIFKLPVNKIIAGDPVWSSKGNGQIYKNGLKKQHAYIDAICHLTPYIDYRIKKEFDEKPDENKPLEENIELILSLVNKFPNNDNYCPYCLDVYLLAPSFNLEHGPLGNCNIHLPE